MEKKYLTEPFYSKHKTGVPFHFQSAGAFDGANFAVLFTRRLTIWNGNFRLHAEADIEKSAGQKLADDLPACKKGCDRSALVVFIVQDSSQKGYMVECGSCQNGTPIMELTEAVKTWVLNFSMPQQKVA